MLSNLIHNPWAAAHVKQQSYLTFRCQQASVGDPILAMHKLKCQHLHDIVISSDKSEIVEALKIFRVACLEMDQYVKLKLSKG
ncbi:hypothetical protein H5232_11115 [Pseudoalteromonas sp. SG41-5]|uniref:hypothetical protein n=1 Tax=Pseudoalteromonas sp. SG41-5 TaxID=2760975 RepID=UPI00160154FD|nr:hypothetical protein [Pseudoalteromonas sp. SG41-5]MBB1468999.1 hypothetical protein [Pseudoalteromonas sp. SG41-5]